MTRFLFGVSLLVIVAVGAAPLVQRAGEDAAPAVAAEAAPQAPAPAVKKMAGLQLGDVLIAADRSGHFRVDAQIQGRRVSFVADTGATAVVLRESEALRLGLPVMPADYTVPVSTANGAVDAAPVTIPEITVGRIRVASVRGLVLPDRALSTNLLGMTFLSRLKGFQIAGDKLILSD